MFKYIIVSIVVYWIIKRLLKLFVVVQKNGSNQTQNPVDQRKNPNQPPADDGEFVEYEEIE